MNLSWPTGPRRLGCWETGGKFLALAAAGLLVAVAAGHGSGFQQPPPPPALEAVEITEANVDQLPGGGQAEGIIGDLLLRNGQIEVVVAQVKPGRAANDADTEVSGIPIDACVRGTNSDLLTAFHPGGVAYPCSKSEVLKDGSDGELIVRTERPASGSGSLHIYHDYSLRKDDRYLTITTTFLNEGNQPVNVDAFDRLVAPQAPPMPAAGGAYAWFADPYRGVACGIMPQEGSVTITVHELAHGTDLDYSLLTSGRTMRVEPGQSFTLTRYFLVGKTPADLEETAGQIRGGTTGTLRGTVYDDYGGWVSGAKARIVGEGIDTETITNSEGTFLFHLPVGIYRLTVSDYARPEVSRQVAVSERVETKLSLTMRVPSSVVVRATDTQGLPVPCAIQILGTDGTPDPYIAPAWPGLVKGTVRLCPSGTGVQPLAPGRYRVIVSRGPEYDAVEHRVRLAPGQKVILNATLTWVVDSSGWVAALLGAQSTASGENPFPPEAITASAVAQDAEFLVPAERNRISDFGDAVRALRLSSRLTTVAGLECAGLGYSLCAFPVSPVPHTQGAGAPVPPSDPAQAAQALSQLDSAKEKFLYLSQPPWEAVFAAARSEGKGFLPAINGVEAFDPDILSMRPTMLAPDGTTHLRNGFAWLQLLNQGVYLTGIAAGQSDPYLPAPRNYIASSTDDPAKLSVTDLVASLKKMHVVMSNGPFLFVSAQGAVPGDTVQKMTDITLYIRVECPNWLDVDRVQVMVNGRPDAALNFTRTEHPEMFGDGVVKFEQTVAVHLESDAHLIVVATGEKESLAKPLGGQHPTAITNPIFVDVQGDGFTPNKDTLGSPLPGS